MNSADLQEMYLDQKSRSIFNSGYVYNNQYDLSQYPQEAVQNVRDIGESLGLTIGQEYPGYDKALEILKGTKTLKNRAQRDIASFLKTDKKSMPFVWKALTGTLFSAPVLIKINRNHEKKK